MPALVISIPHGGSKVPVELRDRINISPADLFDDGDAFTLDIYDVGNELARVVKTKIARAFVDMNRAPDERPPDYPDGVVKSVTCFQQPIYDAGLEPDETLTETLLERYYTPYHERLAQALSEPGVKLVLDCHSMLPTAPPIEPTHGLARPLFCLSNRAGESAPVELLKELAGAIASAFEIGYDQIGLNDPFRGGYITRRYGCESTPVIQVEMNRNMYLEKPWFDRDSLSVDPQRISELRSRFLDALERLGL